MPYSDLHFYAIVKKISPIALITAAHFLICYDFPLYMYLQKLDFLKFNSFRLVEKNVH